MAKPLPYEAATTGDRALAETERLLRRFGVQAFGSMMDIQKGILFVHFRWRDRNVQVEASINGYAQAWLKAHPYRRGKMGRKTPEQHEKKAHERAELAVYSCLRDWLKGQMTAVETGILTFEGAFLGQIVLPTGKTILQTVEADKLLPPGAPS